MVDFMDRDDQEMVAFYHEMASKAAKHHLTLTLHGAYKPTGMERTWPNVLNYEAALNQEYNKWQPKGVKGTPPSHNLDIAFVRMLAGPLDYHQGGMRSQLPESYQWRDEAPPVQGTRGHQLAMYVVYQNHMSMMADYPNAYRGEDGLDFIVEVPANWDETRVLHAEYGKCLIIARRKGTNWYVGGMSAVACERELPLDFLQGGNYDVKLYLDDPAGGPTALNDQQRASQSGRHAQSGDAEIRRLRGEREACFIISRRFLAGWPGPTGRAAEPQEAVLLGPNGQVRLLVAARPGPSGRATRGNAEKRRVFLCASSPRFYSQTTEIVTSRPQERPSRARSVSSRSSPHRHQTVSSR